MNTTTDRPTKTYFNPRGAYVPGSSASTTMYPGLRMFIEATRPKTVYKGEDPYEVHVTSRDDIIRLWTIETAQMSATIRSQIDSMSTEFDQLLEESLLPDDWDQEGALQVSGPAAAIASKILFSISRFKSWRRVAVPDNISALGNGGLFMDWNHHAERLELFIDGAGQLTLVTVGKIDGDDARWTTNRGMTVEDFLTRLSAVCTE